MLQILEVINSFTTNNMS